MTSLAGLAAIVTGASRGIGLAVAQRLVDDGARVCVTGRNADALREAVTTLGGSQFAIGVAGKADDRDHQLGTVAAVMEHFGRIDILVNNAGINPVYGPVIGIDLGAARKVLDVNVLAGLAWTQACYSAWMQENGGRVVNVASVAGIQAADGIGIYGVSKAAVIAMTRQLGHELGPRVRVNAVAPGVVKTEFARALYEADEEGVSEAYPLKRLGVPGDIASAIAFLVSPESDWITGQTIVVDGGITLGARI
ncbi:MAG: SDR family oxidoreductase [Actinomycetota bacterium]|nr:SDR family oxidoreductase [Actinomycetota bacterium]